MLDNHGRDNNNLNHGRDIHNLNNNPIIMGPSGLAPLVLIVIPMLLIISNDTDDVRHADMCISMCIYIYIIYMYRYIYIYIYIHISEAVPDLNSTSREGTNRRRELLSIPVGEYWKLLWNNAAPACAHSEMVNRERERERDREIGRGRIPFGEHPLILEWYRKDYVA